MAIAQISCIKNHCLKHHPNSVFKVHTGLEDILLIFISFFVILLVNPDYTLDFVQSQGSI